MKKNMLFLTMAFLLGACAARRQPQPERPSAASAHLENGEKRYMQYCQKCHPNGEAGLGPQLITNPAPGFLKRFQVRHGLGAMPAFKKDEISRGDLHDIIRYLRSLKKQQ